MTGVPQVVLLCPDPVGARMRGMGIRYTELARALRDVGAHVTLAAPAIGDMPEHGLQLRQWPVDGVRALRSLLHTSDVVLTPPAAPHVMRELRRHPARVAIDLYDPAALEVIEHHAGRSRALRALHSMTADDQLADALVSGDFFVCATERQRDLWIGALLARGRITPQLYDRDPTLRELIDIVPFGVPAAGPAAAVADPIRARFPQIPAGDPVLLWNGGLWRWLDAPTAIRAVARVRERGWPVQLVFMGASVAGGASSALGEARAAVAEAGLDEVVHFNDGWVPYAARACWLQAAAAVISTHRDHLETRYAFRTRLLDCLWAGVPAVVTVGDELATRIGQDDLGATADPGDVDGLADGIERVLQRGRDAYGPALRLVAREYEWPRVIVPLSAFINREASVEAGGRASAVLAAPAARPLRRAAQRLTRLARLVDRR